MGNAKKIVVRSPNWVGDQVMALSFYQGLRALYPNAHLALLCTGNVAGIKSDVFDEQIVMDGIQRRSLRGIRCYGKILSEREFELGISLPASLSSALLLFWARIPDRVGFSQGGSGLFLTQSIPWPGRKAGEHKADVYWRLLSFLEAGVGRRPQSNRGDSDLDSREKLIVVAPGASLPLREWPYFSEYLEEIGRRFKDYRLVVVGGESEFRWHSFLRRIPGLEVENKIGKTTLGELGELLKKAALVVVNDTGVAHMAATLCGAPTLVLFGPGDPKYVTPEGGCVRVARVENLDCSPCESAHCRGAYGYQRCLRDLSLETVLQMTAEMLPSA